MYETGEGVQQDYENAIAWYGRAAKQGLASARFKLGLMYWKGLGTGQDIPKAVAFLRMAAEQGEAAAQKLLGLIYANGQGIPQDYILAYLLFDAAAGVGTEDYVAAKNRGMVARKMSQQQLTDAKVLSDKWKPGTPLPR
jgi:TPR repeat protein